MNTDPVNHPTHYCAHHSGVECIQITEHMNFCLGNAVKYIWRAGLKGESLEDLRKARWYIEREIARIGKCVEVPPIPELTLDGTVFNFTPPKGSCTLADEHEDYV